MDPVILHHDGTVCRHAGKPKRSYHDAGGPACAAGVLVTHVRLLGSIMTLQEAGQLFDDMARAFNETVVPVITGCIERLAEVSRSPAFRSIAAAARVQRT